MWVLGGPHSWNQSLGLGPGSEYRDLFARCLLQCRWWILPSLPFSVRLARPEWASSPSTTRNSSHEAACSRSGTAGRGRDGSVPTARLR